MTGSDESVGDVAQWVIDQCDASPPDEVDGHPDIFSDLEGHWMHDRLFAMWQKGILDAKWDEDAEETAWALTEFGAEVQDRDLLEPYVRAVEEDIQIKPSTKDLEGLHNVR